MIELKGCLTHPPRCTAVWLAVLGCAVLGCGQTEVSDATGGSGGGTPGDAGARDGGASGSQAVRSIEPDAGATPDQSNDGVAESFYPLVDGASWRYLHEGGSTDWEEDVTMTAVSFEGRDAILLSDTPGPSGTHTDSILVHDGERVVRVYKEVFIGEFRSATVSYDPGFTRFKDAWSTAEQGSSETLSYVRTEYDATGAQTSQEDREHTFSVEARDVQVSVPAGDFEGCVQVRRLRIRDPGVPPVEGDDKYFWFCPGVGKVREEEQTTGETEVLVRCDVPGGLCP